MGKSGEALKSNESIKINWKKRIGS